MVTSLDLIINRIGGVQKLMALVEPVRKLLAALVASTGWDVAEQLDNCKIVLR